MHGSLYAGVDPGRVLWGPKPPSFILMIFINNYFILDSSCSQVEEYQSQGLRHGKKFKGVLCHTKG